MTTRATTTANQREIEQFTHLAMHWWDEQGPMQPLHRINLVRMPLLKRWIEAHGRPIKGAKILDVGCGGGLVCEPLARLGAQVTGIDAGQENIEAAINHAKQSGLNVDYICTTAEDFKGQFDVVLALEIIEHVDEPELFVKSLLTLVKPGGVIIMSTINRNPKSFALGIVAAEYILRWLPRGTHSWRKFKKPSELSAMLSPAAKIVDMTGMVYDPLKRCFAEDTQDVDVNYFLCAVRHS
ncbi:MAG TPA: bifunctional 2-polyprenyl-6-hydroxyphenol methylase/3-demethylubiquinol 3-O-methyltransferase UbiG [Alphaproteobacteria bacterium]